MTDTALPIIIYHEGYQEFLEYTLAQARYSNPSSAIYVICDDEVINKLVYKRGITIINCREYYSSASEFEKVYEHFSDNPFNYELVCFIRWFVIYEVMSAYKINSAFICDSDCLIYSNISQIYSTYDSAYGSLIIVDKQEPCIWVASGGESYWNINGLTAFTNFILDAYKKGISTLLKDKILYHRVHKIPGGVCDMTLLYKFYIEDSSKFSNILTVKKGAAFDVSIGNSSNEFENEYLHDGKTKKISFINRIPFCYNQHHTKYVKFHLLHFQGATKNLIKHYYTGPWSLSSKLAAHEAYNKIYRKMAGIRNKVLNNNWKI